MTTEITVKQKCRDCQQEYEARKHRICESVIDLSSGYCNSCRSRRNDEENIKEIERVNLERTKTRAQWRSECGIRGKFLNTRFADYDISWAKDSNNFATAKSKCERYAQDFPLDYRAFLKNSSRAYPSLILTSPGTQGVGKTHLANSICHSMIDRWQGEVGVCPVRIISEANLYQKIEETYSDRNPGAATEASIVKQLVWVPLLIVDDVGTETRRSRDFANRIMFAIVNGRYENNRPMVMTTNLSQTELQRYLSDAEGRVRIFDRLIEMCGGKVFQIEGPSHRLQPEEK